MVNLSFTGDMVKWSWYLILRAIPNLDKFFQVWTGAGYITKFPVSLPAEKKEMTGLAIGISSMKAGERALLHVGWELGYGKEGSFSFPNVPPMADILYEVELIGFDETKEVRSCILEFNNNTWSMWLGILANLSFFHPWTQGKPRSDMTVEERIGAADRRKMDGNTLFKDDKLEEAMLQYEMVFTNILLLVLFYWPWNFWISDVIFHGSKCLRQ